MRRINPGPIICLFFIILVSIFIIIQFKIAAGPFWLSQNSDPDYQYLLNSLNIAQGKGVGHTDHPGTPVQISGAILLKLSAPTAPVISLQENVLRYPEKYLNYFSNVLIVIILILLAVLFYLTWNTSSSLIVSGIFISLLFFSPALSRYLIRFSPEPFLVICSLLIQIAIVRTFTKNKIEKKEAVIFSILCGLGIAVKITFLPLVLLPIFILNNFKKRLFFLSGIIPSFLLFTFPVWNQYRRIARWFLNMLTHTGKYGYGEKGIISGDYLSNLASLFSAEPVLLPIFLTIAAYLLYSLYTKNFRSIHFRAVAGVFCAVSLQVLMTAKHPGAHYLIPSLALVPFAFGTMILDLSDKSGKNIMQISGAAVWILILALSFIKLQGSINKLENIRNSSFQITETASKQNLPVIRYYGASSVEWALQFANEYALSLYSHKLREIYGDQVFYDHWMKVFYRFGRTDPNSFYPQQSVLQGVELGNDGTRPEFPVEILQVSGKEALYRLVR